MNNSEPWYRGAKVPDRSDRWEVTAVAHRSLASEETFVCEVTGQEVPANSTHLLVTVRREGGVLNRNDEFVVVDEETLRDWLELGE